MKIGAIEGGILTMPLNEVTPSGMPTSAVSKMPSKKAPLTFLTSSTEVMMSPIIVSPTPGVLRSPSVMSVAGLSTITPPLFSPRKARNRPMPAEMAWCITEGTVSTSFCRRPVMVKSMKSNPSRNTAVSANCHE